MYCPVVVAAIGGHEGLIVDLCRDDFLEALAGNYGFVVALVNLQGVQVDIAGVRGERDVLSMRVAILLDSERVSAGLHLLERDVQIKSVFDILAWVGLEGNVYVLVFLVRESDVLDAGGAAAFELSLIHI